MSCLRAQASIEALLVLLSMLILLQILGLSLQTFYSNYIPLSTASAQQQTLASYSLIWNIQICNVGVLLPSQLYPRSLIQNGYLISSQNSSIQMPIFGMPSEQKLIS